MTNNAPIAVFDSGVGGLSVLRHIRAVLPHEHLLYFADSGFVPYGDKSETSGDRCVPSCKPWFHWKEAIRRSVTSSASRLLVWKTFIETTAVADGLP